jgi:hypothetical protein
VIPRFPTESAGLRLLYATLITALRSWKGVRIPSDIWFEIELLRREAFGEPNQRVEKRTGGGVECLTSEVSKLVAFTGELGHNLRLIPRLRNRRETIR